MPWRILSENCLPKWLPVLVLVLFAALGWGGPTILWGQLPPRWATMLQKAAANHPDIRAQTTRTEAQAAAADVGRYLPDPVLEYSYLNGNTPSAGNQVEWFVAQELALPGVYIWKKKLAEAQKELAYSSRLQQALPKLVETQQAALQLIHLNRSLARSQRLLGNQQQVLAGQERKLQQGAAIRPDIQQARWAVQRRRQELGALEAELLSWRQQLRFALGDSLSAFRSVLEDTSYLPLALPSLAEVQQIWRAQHPRNQAAQAQTETAKRNLGLIKQQWTPNLRLMYRYQSLLNQTYHGFQAGVSIPLWSRLKTRQTGELQLDAARNSQQAMASALDNRVTALYRELEKLQQALADSPPLQLDPNWLADLNRLLNAGELTVLEYLQQVNFYLEQAQATEELLLRYQLLRAELLAPSLLRFLR